MIEGVMLKRFAVALQFLREVGGPAYDRGALASLLALPAAMWG